MIYCEICKNKMKPNGSNIPKKLLIPVCKPQCLVEFLQKHKNKLQNKNNSKEVKIKIDYGVHNYRSNVEEEVVEHFKLNNIEFYYENVIIYDNEYIYIPDFYLPEFKIFLEVKSGHKQGLIKVKHFHKKGVPIFITWL